MPRLRADPTELVRLIGLLKLGDAQREDLRWLCEALGVALPAAAAPAAAPPNHLLTLPPPLLLRRVLGTLPVTALAAAACTCTALRELSYSGGLEAWRTGGTLLLDCAAHLIQAGDGALPASLARRGVRGIATTAAAVDMSDAQLGALLAGCPQLARISLEECDCLTDAAAPLLAAAPCLQDPKPTLSLRLTLTLSLALALITLTLALTLALANPNPNPSRSCRTFASRGAMG